MYQGRKISLVLGGGGTKGLAHIGVLKVLERRGIIPDEYIGTSVGSFVCAMAAGGMTGSDIERVALNIRRRDILDYDWKGLIMRRGGTRSLYLGAALTGLVQRILPINRFDKLLTPAYLTAVDVNSGQEVVWGAPGWTDPDVHDCVVASCSVPGIYPPKEIGDAHYVDGSLVDTMPIKVAVRHNAELIIAVFLEDSLPGTPRHVDRLGIGAILEQSQSIISRTLLRHNLERFQDSPIVLIQPRIGSQGMFQFNHTQAAILEGERAADEILQNHPLMQKPEAPPASEEQRIVA